ncbi:Bifunctional diguanylate cyclase/phosphodiesterase OS=Streptomyces alboniger OX=132473 GN=CP975_25220 PE=4 SV=1 [Streptomyces alboniger]
MEPTESAAPDSRLRARQWRAPSSWLRGRRTSAATDTGTPGTPAAGTAAGTLSTAVAPRERAWTSPTAQSAEAGAGPADGPGPHEAREPWPLLPVLIVTVAALLLGAGFFQAVADGHALFPSGTAGWSLAALTGLIVGHLARSAGTAGGAAGGGGARRRRSRAPVRSSPRTTR